MAYNSGSGNLPVFITQRTEEKRDSLTSFSTNLSIGEFNLTFDETKQPYSPTETAMGSISKESLQSPIDGQAVPLPDLPALGHAEPMLDTSAFRHIPDVPGSRRSSIDVV